MTKTALFKRSISVLAVVALLLCIALPLGINADDVTDLDEGFISVEDFGATANDNKDDTAAFEAAIAAGKGIYIPEGRFVVTKTIVIEDRTVRGVGSAVSTIEGQFDDKKTPIMIVKGKSTVTDIFYKYPSTSITQDEAMGDRVALQIGDAEKGLAAGSVIRNLFFDFVGTAIYSPSDAACNGVLFDTIEVQHYSYRGVDMQSEGRIGNTYSNFYINDQAYFKCVNACFVLDGSEYAPVLNQINVEHAALLYGMILRNVKGFNMGAVHFEGIAISQDDMGSLYLENSSGSIADLTYILNYVRCYNSSVIRMGDSASGDVVRIGNINLRGVNQPDVKIFSAREDWLEELGGSENRGLKTPQSKTFVVFERDSEAKGEYKLMYENYAYYSYHENEYDFFKSLPTRGNLTVTELNERGAE